MRIHEALLLGFSLASLFVGENAQGAAWHTPPGLTTINLWPHGAPGGAQSSSAPEADVTTAKDENIAGRPVVRLSNVSAPSITFYPPQNGNSGVAVLVFPGGGYGVVSIDLEGSEVCDWLSSIQVTCVLVKYRVPNSGPYPQFFAAFQDAQRAVGIVRAQAKERHIDPQRIGVLGFSVGGHLAALLSTHCDKRIYSVAHDPTNSALDIADRTSCRPDFAVLIYPGELTASEQSLSLSKALQVTVHAPSSFILQTEDDPVRVENAVSYFLALKNADVPAELHLYAEGRHAYGLRHTTMPVTDWPALVEKWMHTIRVLR
jgi:acetyl esterase/lipase